MRLPRPRGTYRGSRRSRGHRRPRRQVRWNDHDATARRALRSNTKARIAALTTMSEATAARWTSTAPRSSSRPASSAAGSARRGRPCTRGGRGCRSRRKAPPARTRTHHHHGGPSRRSTMIPWPKSRSPSGDGASRTNHRASIASGCQEVLLRRPLLAHLVGEGAPALGGAREEPQRCQESTLPGPVTTLSGPGDRVDGLQRAVAPTTKRLIFMELPSGRAGTRGPSSPVKVRSPRQ